MCFNYAATGPAYAFEAAVDFHFLVDIVINFRTGILHEHISSMAKDQFNHEEAASWAACMDKPLLGPGTRCIRVSRIAVLPRTLGEHTV